MIQDVAGYPLGFEENCSYPEMTCAFGPGDTLFLYSDGIVECTNPAGEDFGYERMEKVLTNTGEYSSAEILDLLRMSAEQFSGSSTFEDDVTLLVATRALKS